MLATAYLGLFLYRDHLQGPAIWDEPQYWIASLSFLDSSTSWFDRLRNYGSLNTPLPFLIFAAIEQITNLGLFGGRLFNFLASLALTFSLSRVGEHPQRSALAALGLLSFPYYLTYSGLLYTDVIASLLVFVGVWAYLRNQPALSAVALALAISARQFTIAVPVAILAHEWTTAFQAKSFPARRQWLPPLLAAGTLLAWILLFGGLTTRAARDNPLTQIPRVQRALWSLDPASSLFALGCLGIYYVIPEWLLFHRCWHRRRWLTARNASLAVLLALLFFLFPIRFAHGLVEKFSLLLSLPGSTAKALILFLPALVATVRFSRPGLSFWLVAMHLAVMLKAFPWEKYLIPLLVSLWCVKCLQPQEPSAETQSPSSRPEPCTAGSSS